ncbi:hypothetical protein PTKIN_Ptkin18bG0053000 [Pterospermum kingtungense]
MGKYLRCPNGQKALALFKYERLPDFCYLCGRLDHQEQDCSYQVLTRQRVCFRYTRATTSLSPVDEFGNVSHLPLCQRRTKGSETAARAVANNCLDKGKSILIAVEEEHVPRIPDNLVTAASTLAPAVTASIMTTVLHHEVTVTADS